MSDSLLGMAAFLLAYLIRFETPLFAVTKGYPPFGQYVNVLPFIGVLVPFAFHVQGLYRLRRGRSRVDDFFAVLVGSILAVVFGIVATLYFQAYYVPDEMKDRGAYEVSQLGVGGLPRRERAVHVRLARGGPGAARAALACRHRPETHSHRRRRTSWAGSWPTRSSSTVSSGITSSGSSTIVPAATCWATADCRCSARSTRQARSPRAKASITSMSRCRLDEHCRMLHLLEAIEQECIDVKVVPDLLQVIALRARLEDLDGIPIININDVPLQGFNSVLKRSIDIGLSACSLLLLAIPFGDSSPH